MSTVFIIVVAVILVAATGALIYRNNKSKADSLIDSAEKLAAKGKSKL